MSDERKVAVIYESGDGYKLIWGKAERICRSREPVNLGWEPGNLDPLLTAGPRRELRLEMEEQGSQVCADTLAVYEMIRDGIPERRETKDQRERRLMLERIQELEEALERVAGEYANDMLAARSLHHGDWVEVDPEAMQEAVFTLHHEDPLEHKEHAEAQV